MLHLEARQRHQKHITTDNRKDRREDVADAQLICFFAYADFKPSSITDQIPATIADTAPMTPPPLADTRPLTPSPSSKIADSDAESDAILSFSDDTYAGDRTPAALDHSGDDKEMDLDELLEHMDSSSEDGGHI